MNKYNTGLYITQLDIFLFALMLVVTYFIGILVGYGIKWYFTLIKYSFLYNHSYLEVQQVRILPNIFNIR